MSQRSKRQTRSSRCPLCGVSIVWLIGQKKPKCPYTALHREAAA